MTRWEFEDKFRKNNGLPTKIAADAEFDAMKKKFYPTRVVAPAR